MNEFWGPLAPKKTELSNGFLAPSPRDAGTVIAITARRGQLAHPGDRLFGRNSQSPGGNEISTCLQHIKRLERD